MSDLTHIDKNGNVKMVDVSDKHITHRVAIAQSKVILPEIIIDKFSMF